MKFPILLLAIYAASFLVVALAVRPLDDYVSRRKRRQMVVLAPLTAAVALLVLAVTLALILVMAVLVRTRLKTVHLRVVN